MVTEGVKIFDMNRLMCLLTDWSKLGLGFFLIQKHCNCPSEVPKCCPDRWRLVFTGSRFTHPAESRYAPIEGEALAVVTYSLDRYFVLGCKTLVVGMDHKPLVPVYSDRALDNIKNTRLFNLKVATLWYTFKMVHIPGWQNAAPDATSRQPTGVVLPAPMLLPHDIATMEGNTMQVAEMRHDFLATITINDRDNSGSNDLKAITWDRVRLATTSDRMMQQLIKMIKEGFPDTKSEVPIDIRDFHGVRKDLHGGWCHHVW
jgi:hypothetical protein